MALACVLTIWSGANLWSCIFRWSDIISEDIPSRTLGLFLAILFAVLPMVIAIYLFWSVVVGPEDVQASSSNLDQAQKKRSQQKGRSQRKK